MSKRGRIRTEQSTLIINNILQDLNNDINKLMSVINASADEFVNKLYEYIDYDIKMIRDCTEKSIVEIYVNVLSNFFKNIDEYIRMLLNKTSKDNTKDNLTVNDVLNLIREKSRNELANIYAPDISFDNTIDKYFNDVKREYIRHPMGESELYEMTDDNRDLFIKNNLKTVIECAKRYRGLGVDFEDLIQIGNMGLLKAWYKFDTSKSDLQDNIIKEITEFDTDEISYDDAIYIISNNFKYPKLLEQTLAKVPKNGFATKESFIEWAKDNIRKASFASLGFIWARAAITSELNGLSNIIRIPRSIRNSDDKVTFINLDSLNPHTDDNFNDDELYEIANDEFVTSDDNMENMERMDMFKQIVNDILNKLPGKDRRIIMKRFGINLPFQLSIADISENEGISQREVKSIIDKTLQFIAENISDENKKIIIELL